MNRDIKERLMSDEKYLKFLRENSYYYKILNRDKNQYDNFIKDMKIKYKLRTIDKIDGLIDGVDIITKIISASNE